MESLSPGLPATGADRQGWRLAQVVHDTYERSKLAGFLYLFGWAVVAWLAGAQQFAPLPTGEAPDGPLRYGATLREEQHG